MIELLKVLYNKFGYDKTSTCSQIRSIHDKEFPNVSKTNKSTRFNRLRQRGYIKIVGYKNNSFEYVMQINREVSSKILEEPTAEEQKIQDGEVRFFVEKESFGSIDEAIEYCKKNIIQIKRRKVIWE